MSIKDNYFFAKELAELHKISKQTLIFYDKKISLNQPLLITMAIECILSNNILF